MVESLDLSIKQEQDFDWFINNQEKLYSQYGDCTLVISDKKVFGSFDSSGKALEFALKNFTVGNFIIQECSSDDSCYVESVGI